MRNPLILLLLLAVAGCIGPGLRQQMTAYIGASPQTLVRNLGVPDKRITLGDTQYFEYIRQQTNIEAGPPILMGYDGIMPYAGSFWGPFNGAFYGDLTPEVMIWRCATTFEIQNDKVIGFTMRGNDCG
jgi:hypothetical protein